MKKRVLSALVLLGFVASMSASFAATSAVKSLKNDLINANKKVINTASQNAKANAASKAEAKQKQAAAKQAEAKKQLENKKNEVKKQAETKQAEAKKQMEAKKAKYQKQIDAKKAEMKKVKENSNYTASEKAKKIQAINNELKELNSAVKELK